MLMIRYLIGFTLVSLGLVSGFARADFEICNGVFRAENFGLRSLDNRIQEELGRAPLALSAKFRAFRDQYLGALQSSETREAVLRVFEAELRLRSRNTLKQITTQQESTASYDIIVVGAGIHGVISGLAIKAKNPALKVLIIENSDTVVANFRYTADVFNINSSNRASGTDLPLPGRGNINELPGLPIQVSELSANKYPTSGDLSAAVLAGLYAATQAYEGLDLVLNSSFRSLQKNTTRNGFKFKNTIKTEEGLVTAFASRVVFSTGLGKPKSLQEFKGIAQTPKLLELDPTNQAAQLPVVSTFEDVMRIVAMSNNPLRLFSGKTIAVVGTGDSANVLIELLLGYASPEAYQFSTAQEGLVKKIMWLGQDRTTCEEFIASARSRYAQIGTGFRSSSNSTEAIIEADPGRVSDIYSIGKGKKAGITFERSFGTRSSSTEPYDHVILATGYESGLLPILKEYLTQTQKDFKTLNINNDRSLVEDGLAILKGRTSVSDGKVTNIARVDNQSDPGIFVVGPAAGKLPSNNELVGIIQNSVSIFNNAPRTVAASKEAAKINTKVRTAAQKIPTLELRGTVSEYSAIVGPMDETRLLGNETRSYLISVLKTYLSLQNVVLTASAKKANPTEVVLELKARANRSLSILTDSNIDLTPVIRDLAATRDFFGVAYETLYSLSNESLYVSIPIEKGKLSANGIRVSTGSASNRRVNSDVVIQNAKIKLRGLSSR